MGLVQLQESEPGTERREMQKGPEHKVSKLVFYTQASSAVNQGNTHFVIIVFFKVYMC